MSIQQVIAELKDILGGPNTTSHKEIQRMLKEVRSAIPDGMNTISARGSREVLIQRLAKVVESHPVVLRDIRQQQMLRGPVGPEMSGIRTSIGSSIRTPPGAGAPVTGGPSVRPIQDYGASPRTGLFARPPVQPQNFGEGSPGVRGTTGSQGNLFRGATIPGAQAQAGTAIPPRGAGGLPSRSATLPGSLIPRRGAGGAGAGGGGGAAGGGAAAGGGGRRRRSPQERKARLRKLMKSKGGKLGGLGGLGGGLLRALPWLFGAYMLHDFITPDRPVGAEGALRNTGMGMIPRLEMAGAMEGQERRIEDLEGLTADAEKVGLTESLMSRGMNQELIPLIAGRQATLQAASRGIPSAQSQVQSDMSFQRLLQMTRES